jgi:hypothetical protein
MIVTIKLGELKRIEGSVRKILEMRLPVKAAYNLGKALKRVLKEIEHIDEFRNELIKKYGEVRGEEGNIEIIDPDKKKGFFEEMSTLLEEEISFEFRPIDISVLEIKDSQGKDMLSEFTASDMINLEQFFCSEEDSNAEKEETEEEVQPEKVRPRKRPKITEDE